MNGTLPGVGGYSSYSQTGLESCKPHLERGTSLNLVRFSFCGPRMHDMAVETSTKSVCSYAQRLRPGHAKHGVLLKAISILKKRNLITTCQK